MQDVKTYKIMAKKIKIVLYKGEMPKKAHDGDAAFDLYTPEDIVLKTGRMIIDLGFAIELPKTLAATIQPRSGFASKGMEVVARRGSGEKFRIDADVVRGLVVSCYRGHVGVIINVREPNGQFYVLPKGTRIAQMQIVTVPDVEFEEVEELSKTDRATNGYGSTGAK